MDAYKTEIEQVEDLKRWLKSYGPSILAGILIALAVTYGWRGFQSYKTHRLEKASAIYQKMMTSLKQSKPAEVHQYADRILANYPHSPYATLANFALAKAEVSEQDYRNAIKPLHNIIEHGRNTDFKDIARLRTAQLEIQLSQPHQALRTLEAIQSKSFYPFRDILRGDAYAALDDPDNAQNAYQAALDAIPNADELLPTLRMKMNNLPILDNDDSGAAL